MKRSFSLLFALFLSFSLFAQGDYLYVLAPSGLNLRETGASTSPKITRLPYGAKVNLLGETGEALSVDNLPGNMIKVEYQGKAGFAFSGYMAPFPAPGVQEGDDFFVKYADEIRNEGYNVLQETINRDYGGYYQYEEALEINRTNFYQVFLVARQLFSIPPNLHLPNAKTPGEHVVVNPDKKEMAWSDQMTLEIGKNGEILSAGYSYRAEATGTSVRIKRIEDDTWRISVTYIAD